MPSNGAREILTNAGKAGITDLLEQIALKGLTDATRIATDLPQFLADDDFIAPGALPTRLIGRAACRTYARGGGPGSDPGFNGLWGALCEPYLDSIGENPGDGNFGSDFEGGQCQDVLYRISFNRTDGPGSPAIPRQAGLNGPLQLDRSLDPGDSAAVCAPGVEFKRWTMRNPAGQAVGLGSGCGVEVTNITITPWFGGPDECQPGVPSGDPPAGYEPPRVPTGLPPLAPTIPVRLPGIGPVNVGVSFNPDGTLNVSLPDLGVEVNLPDPTDAPAEPEGGGGAAPPGDVGLPGTPQTSGEGGESAGTAPPGNVLVGVRAEILAFPTYRDKGEGDVYRGAYYLYMGVPGLLDLDRGGAIVRTDQFFFAEKENLTSWRTRANNGFNVRSTPYYRAVA